MYQVLCDGYPLLDWRDNDLILVNPKVKLAVNKVGEASFTLYKNHPHYDKLKRSRSVFEIADEIGVIFRGRMTGDTIDFDNGKAVDLEGVMAYFNDSVVRPYTFPNDFLEDPEYIAASKSGNVIRFWLNWLITNHNNQVQEFQRFKLGNVTVSDPNNYLYRYSKKYANTWETLQADLFKSALGGYLCIRYEADGNYIDYLSKFDQTNTQEIVFGENLMDLKNETDSSATYSAIIPLGKEVERTVTSGTVEGEYVDFELTEKVKGQLDISTLPDGNVTEDIVKRGDTLYSVSAVNQIGWIYAPTSETTWDDVEKAESLLTKGIDWFTANGMMLSNTIEIKAVDLHFSDAQISSFRMYRNINVRSAPHEIGNTYPLSELDIDLLNPQSTIITVGESRMTLIDKQYSENTNAADKIVDLNNQGTVIGIADVKTLYYLSTSGEELTGGEWVTEEPTRTDGTYIWTKNVILYTDKSTYESQPSCSAGAKGDKGDPGIGVDVVLLEYYLSDSSTTQSGGEWVATAPTWSEGKYLWTRGVIYYTDGSKSYTSPVCDSTWDAVTDLDKKLNQEEVFNRLTKNGSLQGLYMENGNMYFNGSFIKSGEILADRIKAGVIKSNDGEKIVIDLDNGNVHAVGTFETEWESTDGSSVHTAVSPSGLHIQKGEGTGALHSKFLFHEAYVQKHNTDFTKAEAYMRPYGDPYDSGKSLMGLKHGDVASVENQVGETMLGTAYAQSVYSRGSKTLEVGVNDARTFISGLDAPQYNKDAVNKAYVDSVLAGKLDTSAIDATWGRSVHTIDVSAYPYSPDYYYPVLVYIPNWIKTRLALIVALNTNVPSWATHESGFSCNIDVSVTRSGWGTQGCSYTKWHDDWRFADKKPAWFGGFVYTSNLAVFYVRGGGIYRMYSDDRDISQPTIVNPSYTDPSGTIYVPVTSQVDYWIGNNFDLDTIETNVKGNVEGNATYAPNSSQLFSSDPNYAYDGIAPYYGHLTYESPYWRFKVYPETPANVIVSRSDSSAYADRAGNADRVGVVTGVYTGSGGAQPPSYVGSNVVRFNMMCNPSGLPAHEYCDYLLMDTYEGGDVPYVTAIGVAKTSVPKAYIAVGQKGNTSTWIEEAEIITTKNACCFDSGAVSTTSIQDSGSGSNFYVVHVYVSGYGYTSIVIDKAQMNTSTYRYYYVHGGGYVGAYKSSNTVTFITDGSSPATTINHIRGYI